MRILVVEDEEKMAHVVKHILGEHGYIVDLAADGIEGQNKFSEVQYDLFIIDVMLPNESGLSFCKKIRERDPSVPILILSALDATEDTVRGLEAGADDYLSKPFESIELLARIRALFRRVSNIKNSVVLNCSDLELDLQARLARRSGKIIQLTLKEFTLLEYLMRNKGKVLSRTQISERGWERPYDLNDNNVDVYINMLRKKVDKGFSPQLIHTVVGMGYVMREPYV
jgi:two-component system copper resistance phosphate regulon response regulator CusR